MGSWTFNKNVECEGLSIACWLNHVASFLLNFQQLLKEQPVEDDQETGEENEKEELEDEDDLPTLW